MKLMSKLNGFSSIDSNVVAAAAQNFGTPVYLYDERLIISKCRALLSMPNAYGLTVRYAMKANSSKSILKIVNGCGLKIDASSMNEVRRCAAAGVDYGDVILTTQEMPAGPEMRDLRDMMRQGLKYNVCSLGQLYNIGDFAAENKINLAVRIHPGVGAGESASRNTGDKYSCFGIHLSDLDRALGYAKDKGVVLDHVHVHIGSGGDPVAWRSNIDLELSVIEKNFPDALTVNFGGGLKEARVPGEISADISALGEYAKDKIEGFYERTGRKLKMEIEPGTYVVANAGFAVTRVIDKKKTGDDGFNFIVLNGGVEINARPLLYGSRHPFYVVSQSGELLFSEFGESESDYKAVLVGKCCESGDSQCLTEGGMNITRGLAEPEIGDFVVIGGTGAYCSSMSPMNYNSHLQVAEALYTRDSELREIRLRQTLAQLIANER